MHVGDRLKALREAKGLNLPQAAEIAGTSKQSTSQIEKGVTKVPGGLFLYRWSVFYGVDLEWLITGKGSPRQSHSQLARLSPEIMAAGWEVALEMAANTTGYRRLDMPSDAELVAQGINAVIEASQQRPTPSPQVDIGGADDGIRVGKVGRNRKPAGEATARAESAPARRRAGKSAA